tara:strand:- start:4331 stop:7507 length:3177 start_codon:yes stop_codon:yes gene_type:complete
MTIFTEKSLRLMPSNALTSLNNALIVEGETKVAKLSSVNAKISKLQGVSTVKLPVGGRVNVGSGGELAAKKIKDSMTAAPLSFANGATVMNDSSTNPADAPVFVPGTTEITPTAGDVDEMSSEVNQFLAGGQLPKTGDSLTGIAAQNKQIERATVQQEINDVHSAIALIYKILGQRASGEVPNPKLNLAALNLNEVPQGMRNTVVEAVELNNEYVQTQIVAPFIENQKLVTSLKAQLSGIGDIDNIFDLEFGPPISAANQFVLSEDGLYYNSRTQSVPHILPLPTSANMWQLRFDSNVGGKGVSFSEEDAYGNVGTIFDLKENMDLANPRIAEYFLYDDVLQQFEDDKQAQMTEVSGYVSEILANGYSTKDAMVQSYIAQFGAVASVYNTKIKKRKRQLEIAAIYGRNIFFVTNRNHFLGEGIFFKYTPPTGKAFEYNLQYDDLTDEMKETTFATLEGGQQVSWNTATGGVTEVPSFANVIAVVGVWTQIPRIPINDFSFLRESDIPLNFQRKITLFSEDLDTIIAPHQARYVVAPTDKPANFTESLAVDMIGYGDWVHRETSGSLSATTPLYKSLTDDIVSNNLLVCYNFLDPDAVTEPSGTLYALNNAAEGSPRLDAKLVGYDKSFVFPSGVGMAYFGGTIFDERSKHSVIWTDIKGSYARLPNSTREYMTYDTPYNGVRQLDNLFYTQQGVTFDFWAHVPNVHRDMTDYHRYRLVLGNENSGPVNSQYITATTQNPPNSNTPGSDNSRALGMIMGWRDRGSPNKTSGYNTSGLEFIISPTVGQNQTYTTNPDKSWGHSICIGESWDTQNSQGIVVTAPTEKQVEQVGMYVPSGVLNSSGFGIADVSSAFHHFNISFDYEKEQVRFTLDGELLLTSSLQKVLGGPPDATVLPTAVSMDLTDQTDTIFSNDPTKESFLGNTLYDERVTPERVAFPVFTPWIIGGGYSDNIPKIQGTSYRPMGFLGSNTNNTHQVTIPNADVATVTIAAAEFVKGQHEPPLANSYGGTTSALRNIPRSGLDGFLGSFKIYSLPLSTTEAKKNYDAQKGFFKNVLIPTP